MMMLFYATPIAYSSKDIPESFALIMKFNPMAHLIDAYRAIFYEQTYPNFKWLGILLVVGLALCIIGYLIFKKLQKNFAEEL